MDPASTEAKEHYAVYRRTEQAELSWKRAQAEICATLLSVMARPRNDLVKVTIKLTKIVTHVRIDLADGMALLSYGAQSEPALYVPKTGRRGLYHALKAEYALLEEQARPVAVPNEPQPLDGLSAAEVKSLLNWSAEIELDDETARAALRSAIDPEAELHFDDDE